MEDEEKALYNQALLQAMASLICCSNNITNYDEDGILRFLKIPKADFNFEIHHPIYVSKLASLYAESIVKYKFKERSVS